MRITKEIDLKIMGNKGKGLKMFCMQISCKIEFSFKFDFRFYNNNFRFGQLYSKSFPAK